MKQALLIAVLALAGFIAQPTLAQEAAPEAAAPATLSATPMDSLGGGKPCAKSGIKEAMPAGKGMQEMRGMMRMGDGPGRPPCARMAYDCERHAAMKARVEQLEKRLDALQLTLEVLTRERAR
jgi:hypothetical protein